MAMRNLHLLLIALLGIAPVHAAGYDYTREYEAESKVPRHVSLPAPNLDTDLHEAAMKKTPILILFSAEYCEFCHRMKQEFLLPMKKSGEYDQRVLLREVDINGTRRVEFPRGFWLTESELARRMKIGLIPTLVVLDDKAHEIVPRQVGLTTVDYFGAYLDDSIDTAGRLMRGERP